jgi:PAS domain S-box-containing protein
MSGSGSGSEAAEKIGGDEDLYRYAVELSQQLIWMADPSGRITRINPRFSEITGLDASVPAHEGWLSVLHPKDVETTLEGWRLARERGEPHGAEFRMRMADGTYRAFRVRAAPRKDAQGRVLGWYGVTEDIHEQKQAQKALRAAEERYRLATRATDDAIWDLDLVNGAIHWSDSASGVFGHPPDEHITSFAWWEERLHPEDRKRVVDSLNKAIEGDQELWSSTYRLLTDAGWADVFDRGFIKRDSSGRALRVVGAMTDVTERRRAQAELLRMQAELIHVSRLSAMGAMASTLAHEINQPLTAVSSYVRGSLRLLEGIDSEVVRAAREALEAAEAGALRAGHIVRRLRELVSRGRVAARLEELPKLIEEACVLGFVDEHVLGVRHTIVSDPAAAWVHADGIQIQQVLINLIRNAVQALQDQPQREIVIRTSAAAGGMVEVSVEDNGTGIDPELREALFSPFQSTNEEGMGIGLSICRTIVEAHGGKIWAEDRDGGGTAFRFTLRAAEPPLAEDPPPPPPP